MAEISLLTPTVLNGVIERLTAPESYLGLNALFNNTEPSLEATAKWDVIEGSREIAAPNVANSEAHIVPHLGIAQRTAAFIYLREKKTFKPTTTRWLRTPGELARKNAEKAILREVKDLDRRFDAFAEWCVWQALTGTLTLDYNDVQATIDYGVAATHKPTVTNPWSFVTVEDWVQDVLGWKRLISLDGRVAASDVWLNGFTWNRVARILSGSPELLSDRMKESILNTGQVSGLLGLNWHIYDAQWVDSSGNEQMFIADDAVFITSSANNAFYVMEGPSADHDAPENHVGKFVKTWKEPDPSGLQHLEEWSFLPIIERAEQIVYLSNVDA